MDRAAVIHVLNCSQVRTLESFANLLQQIAYAEFGILLDAPHIELDGRFPILLNEGRDEADTLLVCGDLCLKVVEVVRKASSSTAAGVLSRFAVEQLYQTLLVELSFRDKLL